MRRAGAFCTGSTAQRVLMALVSLFLTAFGIASFDQPWAAIPAGAAAGMFAVAAVTGWCPAQLPPPPVVPPANALGYDEARQPIDIHSAPRKDES
jgi:hypothetical protein